VARSGRLLRRALSVRRGQRRHHAKESDDRAYLGRKPSFNREQLEVVREMLAQARSIAEIAKATELTRQTVYRNKDDPAACETTLALWGKRMPSA
jgi:putative DNA-invertase from lambdoid prophage Rac